MKEEWIQMAPDPSGVVWGAIRTNLLQHFIYHIVEMLNQELNHD